MPFAYQLPPLSPYQETFIEYRISVPVYEHGIRDGIPYSKFYFNNPKIQNPYYISNAYTHNIQHNDSLTWKETEKTEIMKVEQSINGNSFNDAFYF